MKEKQQSQGKEGLRQQIILAAREQFIRRGIRAVTMDEVAGGLHISKRTLYQLFADKEELLLAVHQQQADFHRSRLEKMTTGSENVLEILLLHLKYSLDLLMDVSPQFLAEVPRYPRLMEQIAEWRRATEESAVSFLRKGVEQGLFRDDVNYRIYYKAVSCMTDEVARNEELSTFSPYELLLNTVVVYLRGCTTDDGRQQLDTFLENYKQERLSRL